VTLLLLLLSPTATDLPATAIQTIITSFCVAKNNLFFIFFSGSFSLAHYIFCNISSFSDSSAKRKTVLPI